VKKLGLVFVPAVINTASFTASFWAAVRSANARQAYSQRPLMYLEPRHSPVPSLEEFHYSANGG
jgi:hypothetical protein